MIGDIAQDVAIVAIAVPGLTVDEILSLPVEQRMQLRTAGMIKSDVKMKPAGGTTDRVKAMVAAGMS